MAIILSFILMSCATIAFMVGFIVMRSSEKNAIHNWYFFIYCCSSSIWCLSCAVIELLDSTEYAYFMRSLMLLSVLIVNNVSIQLFCLWLRTRHSIAKAIGSYFLIYSLLLFPMIITPDTIDFVNNPQRMYYEINHITVAYVLFVIYLLSWLLCVLCITIYRLRKNYHKRQKFMARVILVCWCMYIIGSFCDVILPICGFVAIPTSAMVQFLCLILIYLVLARYNVTQVTIKNVSEYIYRVVEVPVLVLSEERIIEIANASAIEFFGVENEQLIGTDFSNLFVISSENDKEYQKINGKSKKVDAKCLLNAARCSLSITHMYDRYGELIGDIVVVTDLTEQLELIDQLNRSREKAIQTTEAKSIYLANISHEIRTPMNAIVGLSEILMQRNVPVEFRDELNSIYSAGKGLIQILNDVLDFSKIEKGHFDIVENDYSFDELLLDVINVISMRLAERPIYFFVQIQPNIPILLIGDNIRIKQILVNILGNAVKFTNQGFIKLTITMENLAEGLIELHMSVKDTGIGIKKEDMPLLFKNFSQVDTKRNAYLMGTGLGLAITKNLIEMMGGEIWVESTYGEGTNFYWSIRQKVKSTEVSELHKEEIPSFIVFEEDPMVSESITWLLSHLSLEYTIICQEKDITSSMVDSYFIIRKKNYTKVSKILESMRLGERLILILNNGESRSNQFNEYHQISMPLLEHEIMALLNMHSKVEATDSTMKEQDIKLSIPYARVLVVDDNITNLQVAEGLLSSYHMQIDLALSGHEALNLIQNERYDLVFLDQMMPEMDGLETLNHIRNLGDDYYKNVPIIALSAYAVGNARDFFVKKGFSDFLSKPIEIHYLNQILVTYLCKENDSSELEQNNQIIENTMEYTSVREPEVQKEVKDTIEGIDMESAMKTLGGNASLYETILVTFYDDLKVKKADLSRMLKDEDYRLFTIAVHAIKSAARSAGAYSLATIAEHMEELGREDQVEGILAEVDQLYQKIDELIPRIEQWKKAKNL